MAELNERIACCPNAGLAISERKSKAVVDRLRALVRPQNFKCPPPEMMNLPEMMNRLGVAPVDISAGNAVAAELSLDPGWARYAQPEW